MTSNKYLSLPFEKTDSEGIKDWITEHNALSDQLIKDAQEKKLSEAKKKDIINRRSDLRKNIDKYRNRINGINGLLNE